MNHLSRSLLITSLLSCTVTATAAPVQHGTHPWSMGLQGGIGWAAVDTQSTYYNTNQSGAEWTDTLEHNDANFKKAVGVYGAHVGYEYFNGDSSWQLLFSANAGSGSVADEHYVDTINGDASIHEKVSVKNTFNFELRWKHFISSDTYLSLGGGLSHITAENTMQIYANAVTDPTVRQITQSQTLHCTGLVVSMGVGFFLDEDSSFDMGISYYTFGAKSLNDSPQLDSEDGDDSPDYIKDRKNQLSLVALTVGYSRYF